MFSLFQIAAAEDSQFSYDGKTEFIKRDASFNSTPPIFTLKIKNALDGADWILGDAYNEPILATGVPANSITIMGNPEATEEQILALLLKRNPNPFLTTSPAELIRLYYVEGAREGIRADLALCQAFKETGYFKFGGDVLPEQNNYCGLGAVGGGIKGAKFITPEMGVRAHIQHLMVYATSEPPKAPIEDPRYELVKTYRKDIFGNVNSWTGLNGKWSVPGTYYGEEILKSLRYALAPNGSQESIDKGNAAVKDDPTNNLAYIYRGIAYFNAKNLSKAEKNFSKSLSIKETWEGYYNRALVYEEQGKRAKAIEDYANALRISPTEYEAWYNRGLNYFALGKYGEAASDFTEALKINPHIAEAAIGKAIAEIKLKQYDAAWADFYKASQINTNNPIVKVNRAILKECCGISY